MSSEMIGVVFFLRDASIITTMAATS